MAKYYSHDFSLNTSQSSFDGHDKFAQQCVSDIVFFSLDRIGGRALQRRVGRRRRRRRCPARDDHLGLVAESGARPGRDGSISRKNAPMCMWESVGIGKSKGG